MRESLPEENQAENQNEKMAREGAENKERRGKKKHEAVKTRIRHVYGGNIDDTCCAGSGICSAGIHYFG